MSIERITAAKGVAKDLVTEDIASLKNHLVVENGKFLFDEIDRIKAQELYQKLKKSFSDLYDLQCSTLYYYAFNSEAKSLADLQAEEEALEKSKETYSAVREKYIAVNSHYIQYEEALAVSIDEKQGLNDNEKADPKKAEDSAKVTNIVLPADSMESNKTKLEDNSIKYPVDVGVESATM